MSKIKNRGEGEYLVDVCWWNEKRRTYCLELALESEWNTAEGEIDHDFYKLIDIKAINKIWLCSYTRDTIYDKRKSYIIKCVRKARFRFPQEKYLIINLPDSQKETKENRLTIKAFWIDYEGNAHKLPLETIERY